MRVSPEDEAAGLDITEHGMHAYPPSLVVDSTMSPVRGTHCRFRRGRT